MFFLMYKITIISTNMLMIILSTSINNWFMMWLMNEMNVFMMITLMDNKMNENSMKYFIVQAMSSSIMMSSLLMTNSLMLNNMMNSTIMSLSIMIKLSMIPFHFWLISVCETVSWTVMMMLNTTQKITPLIMMNYLMNKFTLILIISSTMILAMSLINQTAIRKIIIISSNLNISWMLMILYNKINWLMFMSSYMMLMASVMLTLNKHKIILINQKSNKMLKLNMLMLMYTLMSLPPTIMFIPKWLIINKMINSPLMLTMMITSNTITIMIYFKMMIYLINYSHMNKWSKKTSMKYNNFNLMMLSYLLM